MAPAVGRVTLRLLGAAGTAAQVGFYPRHRRSLPVSDVAAGAPGPCDVRRVAQFDERMISAEVAECLWVYGGTDRAVQLFGRGKQVFLSRTCGRGS
jgi:hypothetical protein